MKDAAILQPVIVQVFLTFVLLFWMAKERVAAVRAKTVTSPGPGQRPIWPERAAIVSNAFHNQLEMPMLFYAACAFAMLAGIADGTMVTLAWAYAALRIIHAAIHTTYNRIFPDRFGAYLASNLVVIAMWLKIAVAVFTAG